MRRREAVPPSRPGHTALPARSVRATTTAAAAEHGAENARSGVYLGATFPLLIVTRRRRRRHLHYAPSPGPVPAVSGPIRQTLPGRRHTTSGRPVLPRPSRRIVAARRRTIVTPATCARTQLPRRRLCNVKLTRDAKRTGEHGRTRRQINGLTT